MPGCCGLIQAEADSSDARYSLQIIFCQSNFVAKNSGCLAALVVSLLTFTITPTQFSLSGYTVLDPLAAAVNSVHRPKL